MEMTTRHDESWFYISGGPVAAVAIGMALIPLRGHTPAANFTFVFMALTIAVAGLGGRAAATATALASALSLNFFLTQPYLRLAIHDVHDIIAFGGLAACGLIAAAFGSRRGDRLADLEAAREQLRLLHTAAVHLERGATDADETELKRILEASRGAFPLAAAALRDARGYTLAAAGPALERPLPVQLLQPDSLLPVAGETTPVSARLQPLPEDGARLPLRVGPRQVGWLDLWGDGQPANLPSRHALSALARLLAAGLPPSS
jgi:hypothetical protein